MEQKKEWKTPELIVLVRSKPEEAVLASCKLMVLGPSNANAGCNTPACASNCLGYSFS